MKLKFKIITILIIIYFFSCFDFHSSFAALYKSRGDYIPLASIEYDSEDNAKVFPESYKESITTLKEKHPNWTFMAVYTNLDWNETVKHESYLVNDEISLVHMSEAACWKKDGENYFRDGTWVVASLDAVKYALDPRNYLTDTSIFQFESLSCIEGVHKLEAVEKILENTELGTKYKDDESGNKVVDYPKYTNTNGISITMEKTYAQIIYEAGVESKVSPIHIASRIIQETGAKLSNGSICGTNPNYTGYYNFFNIGAVPGADGNSAVTNGLKTAKNNGWDTPEKSIKAGALTLYNSYIKYGQDTIYFQKFDVSNTKGNATMLYAFQYMTSIKAPNSEAYLTYKAYEGLGILDSAFVFYIPVYNSRTKSIFPRPDSGVKIDENDIEVDGVEDTGSAVQENKEEKAEDKKVIEESENVIVTGIELEKKEYTLPLDKVEQINVTVLPENAKNKEYTATVEDESIAKFEEGKITALKIGETNIVFATAEGDFKASAKITVIEKPKYEVDKEALHIDENNIIRNLNAETKVKDLLAHITCGEGLKVQIKNINGDLLNEDSFIGTGSTITIYLDENTIYERFDITVRGDVNGDGKITASDYVLIKNQIMGTSSMSNIQIMGADVNGDGKITASDYVLIKNHIMGISKLY